MRACGTVTKNVLLLMCSVLLAFILVSCGNGVYTSSNGGDDKESGVDILFGNNQGLVFHNGLLLPSAGNLQIGESGSLILDGTSITSITTDQYGNAYAGTYYGSLWQLVANSQYWKLISIDSTFISGDFDGSPVTSLAIANNQIYAGTANGAIFTSSLMNFNWRSINNSFSQSINSIAVNSSGTIYAGLNDGSVWSYINSSWSQLGSNLTSAINTVIFANGNLYASTSGGSGNGQTFQYNTSSQLWDQLGTMTDGQLNSMLVDPNSNIYVATQNGNVWKLLNNTSLWLQQSGTGAGGSINDSPVTKLALDNSGYIYAATESSPSNYPNAMPGQVFKLKNGVWQQLGNLDVYFYNYPGYYFTVNSCAISALNVANNGNIFAGTNRDCAIPLNGGAIYNLVYQYNPTNSVWSNTTTGTLDGTAIYGTLVDANGDYYVGTQSNVFKYDHISKTWAAISQDGFITLDGSEVQYLAKDSKNNLYIENAGVNIYQYTPGSNSLVSFANNPATPCDSASGMLIESGTDNIYISAYVSSYTAPYGGVWEYINATKTWTQLKGSGESGSLDSSAVSAIVMDESHNLFASTAGDDSLNPNGGQVFQYIPKNNAWVRLGNGPLDGSQVSSLAVDKQNVLYAATYGNHVYKYESATWVQVGDKPIGSTENFINAITFDRHNNLIISTVGFQFDMPGVLWYFNRKTNTWDVLNYNNGSLININSSIKGI